ncbi:MAG: acyclic terpene utilization AtuA family protein, partial [Pirellulales bacterium]
MKKPTAAATCAIANAAGFLGDNLDAPRRLVESARVDYLTLEYLAELTLSILARLREKDPNAGYANDFLDVLASLVPALRSQPQLKIVSNAGGMNPLACARAAAALLADAGLGDLVIGVVTGDDLLDRLPALEAGGWPFENLDTKQPLRALGREVASANAYLGGRPIAEALDRGARLVLTGRVADASLTVGPAVHAFGWKWDDWRRLAGASVAGHLIECGAQVTGGFYPHWQRLDLARVGYPIAELAADGNCVITKPPGTGGAVNRETVAEQLVYEIGDPSHYLTPDVDVDFTAIDIESLGADRVAVRGATGRPPPVTYKVSLAYRDGYFASGQLLVYGDDCVAKARAAGEMLLARVSEAGYELERSLVECLGAGDGVPGVDRSPAGLREVVLRVTAADPRREAVERFSKEFAPLATSGPGGLAGYASG